MSNYIQAMEHNFRLIRLASRLDQLARKAIIVLLFLAGMAFEVYCLYHFT